MRTKYNLHIDNETYELRDDDLCNWDEIRCSFKRDGFGGVVRSFTSKFEFANNAAELLRNLFLRDRFNSSASIAVLTLNDSWEYVKQFECPLDFSTIEWESNVLSINSVDNSLAALIKANKGTKYEFVIGSDIIPDRLFRFDRIPMRETLTYAFTQGTSMANGDLAISIYSGSEHLWLGNIGSEIFINNFVNWNEDQTDSLDSYVLEVEKDLEMLFEYDIVSRTNEGNGVLVVSLGIIRNGSIVDPATPYSGGFIDNLGRGDYEYRGSFISENHLKNSQSPADGRWAIISGIVWMSIRTEIGDESTGIYVTYSWFCTGKTVEDYFKKQTRGSMELHLQAGDKVLINCLSNAYTGKPFAQVCSSNMKFSWLAEGEPANIDVFKPKHIAEELLDKIVDDKIDVSVDFSTFDRRLANTYILAAESARAINGARFYSSFTEFVDWMESVFGYVYYLGQIEIDAEGSHQTVYFVHRSELFNEDATVYPLAYIRGLKYNVDSSSIYSSVVAGYEKKDYDNINGRYEFNFNNTYTTGCNVTDKTLSLLSKYRADCYGIEFAVQKRGEDTTDTTSDKDVFFALLAETDGILLPDRSIAIEGALCDKLFNGAFSPMACVHANAGYIGLQASDMLLSFASSTGNSDILIDGESMASSIEVNKPLASNGVIEFTTDDVATPSDINELVRVESGGFTYVGFIKEVDVKYARQEAAKYKLIVKEIMA